MEFLYRTANKRNGSGFALHGTAQTLFQMFRLLGGG